MMCGGGRGLPAQRGILAFFCRMRRAHAASLNRFLTGSSTVAKRAKSPRRENGGREGRRFGDAIDGERYSITSMTRRVRGSTITG